MLDLHVTVPENDATAPASILGHSNPVPLDLEQSKSNPVPFDLEQIGQDLARLSDDLSLYNVFRTWAMTFSQEYTEGDQFHPQVIDPNTIKLMSALGSNMETISSEQLGLLLRDLDEDILPCHNVLKLLISTALESALESDQHVLEDAEASLALQARYSFFKPLNILMIQMDSAESNRGIGDLDILQLNLQGLIEALDEKFDEAKIALRALNGDHDLKNKVSRLAAQYGLSLAEETLSEDEAVEEVAQDNPVDLHAIRAGAFYGLMISLLGLVVLEFLPFSMSVIAMQALNVTVIPVLNFVSGLFGGSVGALTAMSSLGTVAAFVGASFVIMGFGALIGHYGAEKVFRAEAVVEENTVSAPVLAVAIAVIPDAGNGDFDVEGRVEASADVFAVEVRP